MMIRTPSQNRLLNSLMAMGPPPLNSARGLQQPQLEGSLEDCFYSLDQPGTSPTSTCLLAHPALLPRPRRRLLLKPVPKKIQGSHHTVVATLTSVCKNDANHKNLFVPIGLPPATNSTAASTPLLPRFPSLNERHPYKLMQCVSSRSCCNQNPACAGYSRINREARLPLTIPARILVPEL